MRETEGVRPSLSLFRYGEPHIRYFFSTDESLPERCFECVEYLALEGEEEIREELAKRKYLLKINTIGYKEHYGEIKWTGEPRMLYEYDYLFALISLDPSPKVRLSLLQNDGVIERGFLRVPYLIPIYALDEDKHVRKLFWDLWYNYVLSIGEYYGLTYPNLSIFFPDVKKESELRERWLYFYDEEKDRYERLLHERREDVIHLLIRPDVGLFDVGEVVERLKDKSVAHTLSQMPSYLKFLYRKDESLKWHETVSSVLDDDWLKNMNEKNDLFENTLIDFEILFEGVNIVRAREIVEKAFSKRVRQLPEGWRETLKEIMQKLLD